MTTQGVNLAAFVPQRCRYGHLLWLPRRIQLSWSPCLCPEAQEDMKGHLEARCTDCHVNGADTVFYDPPRSAGCRDPAAYRACG